MRVQQLHALSVVAAALLVAPCVCVGYPSVCAGQAVVYNVVLLVFEGIDVFMQVFCA